MTSLEYNISLHQNASVSRILLASSSAAEQTRLSYREYSIPTKRLVHSAGSCFLYSYTHHSSMPFSLPPLILFRSICFLYCYNTSKISKLQVFWHLNQLKPICFFIVFSRGQAPTFPLSESENRLKIPGYSHSTRNTSFP